MDIPTIWKAEIDAPHYTFEAYGVSEEMAEAAMIRALEAHYDTHPKADLRIMREWMTLTPYVLGQGYRDKERITA